VALFLFSYKGYDRADRVSSFIAATGALATAVFPTNAVNTSTFCEVITKPASSLSNTVHFLGAAVFFVTLAYMSIFLFTQSDKRKEDQAAPKRNRNRVYRTCGIIMIIALIGILLLRIPAVENAIGKLQPEFWFEAIALWAFGFSWLVKGETILKDKPQKTTIQVSEPATHY
jgi:amino acid transporter